MYKIDKFRLQKRCTSLIVKLNHQWKNIPRDLMDWIFKWKLSEWKKSLRWILWSRLETRSNDYLRDKWSCLALKFMYVFLINKTQTDLQPHFPWYFREEKASQHHGAYVLSWHRKGAGLSLPLRQLEFMGVYVQRPCQGWSLYERST